MSYERDWKRQVTVALAALIDSDPNDPLIQDFILSLEIWVDIRARMAIDPDD